MAKVAPSPTENAVVPITPGREPMDVEALQALRYEPGDLHECDADIRACVQMLAEDLKSKKKKFTDDTFSADNRSLLRHPNSSEIPIIQPMPSGWKRLSELDLTINGFPEPEGKKEKENPGPHLFGEDGATPEDVVQGNLGSCFLLGAFSVLAAESQKNKGTADAVDLIKSIVVAHDVEACIYGLRFFQNGCWRPIIIDDYVPIVTGKNGDTKDKEVPNFGWNADPQEMWVALLEKAYAKLYHVYEHLDGGVGRHALEDLTGGTARRIYFHDGAPQRIKNAVEPRVERAFKKRWGGAEIGGESAELKERHMWGPSSNGVWKILLSRPNKKATESEDNTHLLPEKDISCEFSLHLKQGKIQGGGVLRFVKEEGLITVVKCEGRYTMAGEVEFTVKRVAGRTSIYQDSTWKGNYHKQVKKVGSKYLAVIFSQLEDLKIDFGEGEISVPADELFGGGVLKEKFPSYVTAFDSFFDELFLKSQAGAVMSVVLEDTAPPPLDGQPVVEGEYRAETQDKDSGLLRDHAYGVIDVRKINGFSMLQLRNPHASGQWLGKFGDKDPNWPSKLKKKLRVKEDDDDGIFWMNYQDFINTWSFVDICRVFNEKNWNIRTERGSFYEGARCGGPDNWADNPQYRLWWESQRVITFVIRLSQPDTKLYTGEDEYPISIGVKIVYGNQVASRMLEHVVRSPDTKIADEELKIVEELAQELTIADTVLVDEVFEPNQRSVSLEVSLAPRGIDQPYLIIPYTSVPNVTLPYVMNVYGNAPYELSKDFEGGGPIEADEDDPSESDESNMAEEAMETAKEIADDAVEALDNAKDTATKAFSGVTGALFGSANDEAEQKEKEEKERKEKEEKERKEKDEKEKGESKEEDKGTFGGMFSSVTNTVKSAAADAKDAVEDAVEDAKEKVEKVADAIEDALDGESDVFVEVPGDEFATWFYQERYDLMADLDEMSEAADEAEKRTRLDLGMDPEVEEKVKLARIEAKAEAHRKALESRKAFDSISAYTFGTNLKMGPRRGLAAKASNDDSKAPKARGANAESRGRNVKARGVNDVSRGRNVKARGRSMKARGRTVKARGRSTKARGRTTKARGRAVKARGRAVKARGRTMKARGRAPKARGSSVRECLEREKDDMQERAGNAMEAAGSMAADGAAALGMGDVNKVSVLSNVEKQDGPYAPDYEYTMREGQLFMRWGGAEGGGDKWNSGIFDCKDDCGHSCKTLVCCARSVVDQRRFLEGRNEKTWNDTKDEVCLVFGSLLCFGIPVCRYTLANRQLTRMFFSIEEGDATNPFSGRDLTDKAAMCLFCCANCQQQRQIDACIEDGADVPPPNQSMTRQDTVGSV